MTLLAFDSWVAVKAWREGPKYKVGPSCAAPGCTRYADHAHHVQRRSFFGSGTPCDWVIYGPDEKGETWRIGNLVGLCWECHQAVTENRARIFWTEAVYRWRGFVWEDETTKLPLDPQPPMERLGAAGPPRDPVSAGSAEALDMQLTVDGREVPHDEVVHQHDPLETCPGCHGTGKRRKKKKEPQLPTGEKRPRKTWSLHVPADAEDGAEVLDGLLQPIAEKLGRADHKSWKYFTLVEALVFVNQHLHQIEEEAA